MSNKQDKHDRPGLEKRSYHAPQLYIYGDVNKLTRGKISRSTTVDGTVIWGYPLRS